MQNKKSTESITLTIRGRLGAIINKEEVFAVSSINPKGLFDILPEHENFISLIKDLIVVHKTRKDKQEIKIDKGVLKVTGNIVNIFLGMHSD